MVFYEVISIDPFLATCASQSHSWGMNRVTISKNDVTITGLKVLIFIPALKIYLLTTIYIISVFIILLLLIIFTFRRFVSWKKNVPGEFFAEALRNENNGYFETALINYERALEGVKKSRFRGSSLESIIIEKLKVLHTVIGYKNGFHFGRQHK